MILRLKLSYENVICSLPSLVYMSMGSKDLDTNVFLVEVRGKIIFKYDIMTN